MKPNMKKKFDFSAEMNEAESIKATPKNEYLEEEKRLLKENIKELASLNDNVYKLRTEVESARISTRVQSGYCTRDAGTGGKIRANCP